MTVPVMFLAPSLRSRWGAAAVVEVAAAVVEVAAAVDEVVAAACHDPPADPGAEAGPDRKRGRKDGLPA